MSSYTAALFLTLFVCVLGVFAETHTITFDNQCGEGTPHLVQDGTILSTGEAYTSSAAFSSAIAYLQTGDCLLNGEGCPIVEMSLVNPTCAGCGSSADISLIPPHAYTVPVSFNYSGGCDGQGALCASSTCSTAFFESDDNQVQVACQEDDVNLVITFCGDGATSSSASSASTPSSSHLAASTSDPVTKQLVATASSSGMSSSKTSTAAVPASPTTPVAKTSSDAPKCSQQRRRRSLTSESSMHPNTSRVRRVHQNRRHSFVGRKH